MSATNGVDIATILQNMVVAIVGTIAALVQGLATFIQNNAALFATILGFITLGVLAIRFGRGAFNSVVSWFRNLL